MTERVLPPVTPILPGKPDYGDVSSFQDLARGLASGDTAWTAELRALVATLFDDQAPTWNHEHSVNRFDPVTDALTRVDLAGDRCLELGSGTGQITRLLTPVFEYVVCVDISAVMLAQAFESQCGGLLVRADASGLPFADASMDAVVAVDTFLFAADVARVLAPTGALVWINLLGRDGPLYVPTNIVARSLPGDWDATSSTANWGTWSVLRRTTT